MTEFEQAILEVWRQALVENAKSVRLAANRYPVRKTGRSGLRQVDFVVDGQEGSGAGAKPGHQVAVGADGAIWEDGDAVPQCWPVRRQCGGWQNDALRRADFFVNG